MYPDPRLTQPDPLLAFDTDAISKQGGLFASLKVHLSDDWSVVGGARIASDRIISTVTVSGGGRSASESARFGNSRVTTPYFGVLYDINEHYSLYASYADIYRTFGLAERSDGRPLGAANGVDIEVGAKGVWRRGALNGALVFYRIEQSGLPMGDPAPRPPGASSRCCFIPVANRSKGADVELSGAVAPNWLVGAGYTYNLNRAAEGGELTGSTPRHLLKVWTSTQLLGRLSRWEIGGNLHAQGAATRKGASCPQQNAFGSCTANPELFEVTQGPFVFLDLRAGYTIDSHWRAALTVNNVFDKTYYQTVGGPQSDNWYGEPRGVLLRVDGLY